MENTSVYKTGKVDELRHASVFLLPYSPKMNHVEEMKKYLTHFKFKRMFGRDYNLICKG